MIIISSMDISTQSLNLHKKYRGKIAITSKVPVNDRKDLSLVYTPGVGAVSQYLHQHPEETNEYTWRNNTVAVISDGSAVLGLGNIGPEAALPVMEGKCLIFKRFANIDAIPLVLSTQNPQEIIRTIQALAPTFGGINIEDIAAPNCFVIEEELKRTLSIPVVHDDQWGAAIACLAGLINALKLSEKIFSKVRIVISGAGAAGSAIAKLLHNKGAKNMLILDRQGIISRNREGNTPDKQLLAEISNPENIQGNLMEALKDADVFIGVSKGGTVSQEMVKSMHTNPIIFAMANPVPEIMPDEAKAAGAYIVASGRSDYSNQVNNALVFPGMFRGALDNKVHEITRHMMILAAENIAQLVPNPTPEKIIPSVFDEGVVEAVESAIK
jgi:malate dehydrogenase (oxaloacetate-decarboxylating)